MPQSLIRTNWRDLFQVAVAGWNAHDNVERLDDACNAIYRRLQVRSISESVPSEERGELRDALHFLHLLGQAAETEARSYKRVYLLRRGA